MWLIFSQKGSSHGVPPLLPQAWHPDHSLGIPDMAPSGLVIPWTLASPFLQVGSTPCLSSNPTGTCPCWARDCEQYKLKGTLSILWKGHQQLLLPDQEQVRAGDSLVLAAKTKKKTQAGTAAEAKTVVASRLPPSVTSFPPSLSEAGI